MSTKDPRSELEEKIDHIVLGDTALTSFSDHMLNKPKEIMQAVDSYVGEREIQLLQGLLDYWKTAKLDTKYDVGKTAGHVHEMIQQFKAERKDGV